jgi:integrase
MTTALIPAPAPDYAKLIDLVSDSVASPFTKAAYRAALLRFFSWWASVYRQPFSRAAVNAYRTYMEELGKGVPTINIALSAIRKFAAECMENGVLDSATESSIARIPGAKLLGRPVGNWLTAEQAEKLLDAPPTGTPKGVRDRAILGVLLGCGLRRAECATLQVGHVRERDGRPCIVDLEGKGGRIRTVPMPKWAHERLQRWLAMTNIASGPIFVSLDQHGNPGAGITGFGIHWIVREYVRELGFDVSPHDLRRTFARLARQGGGELDQIQFSLGHSSVATTEIYLGMTQDLRNAPCDRLGLSVR